jgi:hypothetical protein
MRPVRYSSTHRVPFAKHPEPPCSDRILPGDVGMLKLTVQTDEDLQYYLWKDPAHEAFKVCPLHPHALHLISLLLISG